MAGTHGIGTFQIDSKFASGNLVFYEKGVGRTATGDVFTIGTAAVKVGGTAQAVDLSWYATGSLSAIISASGATFTLVGISTTTNSALALTGGAKATITSTGSYTSPPFVVTRTFVTADFAQTYHAAARVNLDLTNDVPAAKYASALNVRIIGAGDVASTGQLYGLWVDSAGTGAAIGGTYYMAKFSVQSGAARPTAYMHFESADPGVTYAFVFATNNAPYYNQGGTYSTADGYLLVSTFNGDRRIPLFAAVD